MLRAMASLPDSPPAPRLLIAPDRATCGRLAAAEGAARLRQRVQEHGAATLIVATGASQLDMLDALVGEPDLRWDKVTVFHLDEYLGLPLTHPASFRRYLWERFHARLPLPVRAFHYLDGEADPETERRRYGALLASQPVDLAFIGIGENGHLAFNDPPADFETEEPCLVVTLDDACRRQQWGEGWFATLDDVPRQALSLSVRQILKSASLLVTVPDARKAGAVRAALTGPLTPDVPASILRTHGDTTFFLDEGSASLLPASARG